MIDVFYGPLIPCLDASNRREGHDHSLERDLVNISLTKHCQGKNFLPHFNEVIRN